jgi:radical SAM/Cys-rich protein
MSQTIHLPLATPTDPFADRLAVDGQHLTRRQLGTLQLNLGKMCNLACHHCHVEAGPGRTEIMTWPTMQSILDWVDRYRGQMDVSVIDLTGGAPEMNPDFRKLVRALRERGLHVLDRCNLTILLEPGYEDMAAFLAEHQVEIVASLPCYLEDNVDAQRGLGVFQGSIDALRRLNAVGYGQEGSPLRLDLVYNPVGYGLPPDQASLEADYKRELAKRFDVVFNKLWTITNMPVKRFEHQLKRDGQYDAYMDKLVTAHKPDNVDAVMCRDLVSIGWQGSVYDCDFNQMLLMPLDSGEADTGAMLEAVGDGGGKSTEHAVESHSRKLWQFTPDELIGRKIATGAHCFGCTAGSGSSCTGALG